MDPGVARCVFEDLGDSLQVTNAEGGLPECMSMLSSFDGVQTEDGLIAARWRESPSAQAFLERHARRHSAER